MDILQLSRQKTPHIEITNIYQSCLLSKTQIEESKQFKSNIEIDNSARDICHPDGSQLQQVLTNLLAMHCATPSCRPVSPGPVSSLISSRIWDCPC